MFIYIYFQGRKHTVNTYKMYTEQRELLIIFMILICLMSVVITLFVMIHYSGHVPKTMPNASYIQVENESTGDNLLVIIYVNAYRVGLN